MELTFEQAEADLKDNVAIGSIDVNAGWLPIVVDLHRSILRLDPEDYQVTQIKEKFGGLRFYYSVNKEYSMAVAELVRTAEKTASETCEVCGAPGHLRTERAWLLTLCDRHNTAEPVAWNSGYEDDEEDNE